MANVDNPHGFPAFGPQLRLRNYSVDSSNGTAIFQADVTMMEDDGNVAPATAANTALIGSALSYLAASTATTAANPLLVLDHPDQLFMPQDDGDTVTLAQTHIGTSCDHIAGAGSTVTFISGHEIDISDTNTTSSGFKLLEIVKRPDNAAGANADLVVQLNVGEGLLTLAAGI